MLPIDKRNNQADLEKEAPFLSRIYKENHFHTPENYFKSLPEIISNKKLINRKLKIKIDKLSYRFLIPFSALIVFIFVVLNLNTNNITTETKPNHISELFIEDDYIELDDYLVYEAYADLLEKEETKTTSNDDEYTTYLLENNININTIIEEL